MEAPLVLGESDPELAYGFGSMSLLSKNIMLRGGRPSCYFVEH